MGYVATQTGISDRLRRVLREHGGSIKDFADTAGLPYRTMQSYLNGSRQPNADSLAKLHTQMGIDLNWLLCGEGRPYAAARVAEAAGAGDEVRFAAWLAEWAARADERERTWLAVQLERCFPEYREWLQGS